MLDAHAYGAEVILPRRKAVGGQTVGVGISDEDRLFQIGVAAVRRLGQKRAVVFRKLQRVFVRVVRLRRRRRDAGGRGYAHRNRRGYVHRQLRGPLRGDHRDGGSHPNNAYAAYKDGDVQHAAVRRAERPAKAPPAILVLLYMILTKKSTFFFQAKIWRGKFLQNVPNTAPQPFCIRRKTAAPRQARRLRHMQPSPQGAGRPRWPASRVPAAPHVRTAAGRPPFQARRP